MSQNDIMKNWFRELPQEHPSQHFAAGVMNKVMSEWTRNPIKYQPIISRRIWWVMAVSTIGLTVLLFMLHSSIPAGTDALNQTNRIYGIDLSQLVSLITTFFVKLSNMSPTVAIGTLAIVALWVVDELIDKTVKR